MRRYSQRHQLVTLSDINITPLLDLAFVLLIIFIISTPLIENSIDVQLPSGGQPMQDIQREDVVVIDIVRNGAVVVAGQPMRTLSQLEQTLVQAHQNNPNLIVRIRPDEAAQIRYLMAVIDRCIRNGITRVSYATEPE